MRIEACADNIFVKVIEEKDGDLHIPPVFRRKNQPALHGVVIACGPTSRVQEKDEILFHKWEDNTIILNHETMVIIKPHSILAIK